MHVNLLLFWREVQEYKGLFLKLSFSITAVEMKAKVNTLIIIIIFIDGYCL